MCNEDKPVELGLEIELVRMPRRFKEKCLEAVWGLQKQRKDEAFKKLIVDNYPYTETLDTAEQIVEKLCNEGGKLIIKGFKPSRWKRFGGFVAGYKVRAYVMRHKYPNTIFINYKLSKRTAENIRGTLFHENAHLKGYGHKHNNPNKEPDIYYNSVPVKTGEFSAEWKPAGETYEQHGIGIELERVDSRNWWSLRNWSLFIRIAKQVLAIFQTIRRIGKK